VLTRIAYGTRVSLEVALASVLGAGLLGSALGVMAGYGGGWLDLVIMRVVDVQLSFPFIVLALAVAGILGPSFANIVLTLVISRWVIYARLARGQVLVERERLYVQSAQAIGASGRRVLARHIVPNVLGAIVVMGSLEAGRMVLSEAAISFLGFGVQAPHPSLGGMLAEGRDYLYSAWWLTTAPGAVVSIISLLANLLGDAVHDALEPS
jgi:peptide/nickel transport system permease protein